MSTGRYASETTVTVDKTIGDLRKIVSRYGATEYGVFTSEMTGGVMFTLKERRIKISMIMPTKEESRIDSAGRRMQFNQQRYDKQIRQRWRALLLVVTAKLEGVQSGIETVEQAFMPYLLLPNGSTVGEAVLTQIQSGVLPLLSTGPQ